MYFLYLRIYSSPLFIILLRVLNFFWETDSDNSSDVNYLPESEYDTSSDSELEDISY